MKKTFYKNLVPIYIIAVWLVIASCSNGVKPVTKEEATALANTITQTIARDQAGMVDSIIDVRSFSERLTKSGSTPTMKSYTEAQIAEFLEKAHLGREILRSRGKTGNYQLVKQYEKDQKQHLLFRLYAEGSINYHDFELVKRGNKVKVADMYIYITGENYSKSIGDALVMMTEDDKMLADGMEYVRILKKIKSLMHGEDFTTAKTYYDQLPSSFKLQKLFLMMNIQISAKLSEEQYTAAINEYRIAFPDDPSLALLMIDSYFMQQKYEECLGSINKLDSLINKDPLLDYHRSLAYKQMSKNDKSRECLERLHASMPAFKSATLELAANYLDANEPDKAVQLVKTSRDKKQFDKEDIDILYSIYPAFETSMAQ